MLHLDHLDRRFAHEGLDHVLVGKVVGALDRVEGVGLVAVLRSKNGRGAAFGRDRVAAHRVDLGDHRDLEPGIGLDHGYRCPDAGKPSADYQDVIALKIHVAGKCYAVT
jgi:hypothetical protein